MPPAAWTSVAGNRAAQQKSKRRGNDQRRARIVLHQRFNVSHHSIHVIPANVIGRGTEAVRRRVGEPAYGVASREAVGTLVKGRSGWVAAASGRPAGIA